MEVKQFISDVTKRTVNACFQLDGDHLDSSWTLKEWEQTVSQEHYRLYILEVENTILGFSLWQVNWVDNFAHLLKIVVCKTLQGEGRGRFLLVKSEELLQGGGIRSFYLEVEESNSIAYDLYRSVAYKEINRVKSFYQNGEDAKILYKEV